MTETRFAVPPNVFDPKPDGASGRAQWIVERGVSWW